MTPQASESSILLAIKGSARPAIPEPDEDASDDLAALGIRSVLPQPTAGPEPILQGEMTAELASAQAAPLLPSHIIRTKRPMTSDTAGPEVDLPPPAAYDDEARASETEVAEGEAKEITSEPAHTDDAELLAPAVDLRSGAIEEADSRSEPEPIQPSALIEADEPEAVLSKALVSEAVASEAAEPKAAEPEFVDNTRPADLSENTDEDLAGSSPTLPAAGPDAEAAIDEAPDHHRLSRDKDSAALSPPAESRAAETKDPLDDPKLQLDPTGAPSTPLRGRPIRRELGVAGARALAEPGKSPARRNLGVVVALVVLGLAAVSLIAWSVQRNLLGSDASQPNGESRLVSVTSDNVSVDSERSSAAELAVGSGGYLPSEAPSPAAELNSPASESPASAPPASVHTKAEPEAVVQPKVDVVRIEASGAAVIAGVAAPHSELIVLDKGQPIGTVTVDSRGEWVLLPETPLAKGDHEISLVMKIVSDSVKLPSPD